MTITATIEDDVGRLYVDLDADALADRWSLYSRMRIQAPVLPFGNSILVSRYADVIGLLMDKERVHNDAPSNGVPDEVLARLSAQEREMLATIIDWEQRWLTSVNGRRHAELRGLAQRIFSPRAVPALRARAESLADELLDELDPHAEIDFISRFAKALPQTLISELLDIPPELREPMHVAAEGMVVARTGVAWRTRLPQGLPEAHRSFLELRRFIRDVLDDRRGRKTTPLMENLLEADADPDVDSTDVMALMQLLFTAGHRTTRDLLGNGVLLLATHRDQWRTLCADPALLPRAIEEILRYRSPAQDVERFAASTFEVGGTPIERGQHLTLIVGSANFDAAYCDAPERFDIERRCDRPHLSFGHGPHFCLGNALARMESGVGFAALLRRFPDLDADTRRPDWRPSPHVLGLAGLPVVLGADRGPRAQRT